MPGKRPCLVCGVPCQGARCSTHKLGKSNPSTAMRTHAERRRRRDAVAQWVDTNGWVCPGWQRAPHLSKDLTADHPVAVADGGPMNQPLAVLCRRCNASKGGGGSKV